MKIAIADAGPAFDGTSPEARPLDGAARAVCGLAAALAGRGHRVSVHNSCAQAVEVAGVSWRPLPVGWQGGKEGARLEDVEALIAIDQPALLDLAEGPAVRRILLPFAAPGPLAWPLARDPIERHQPLTAYLGLTQRTAAPLLPGHSTVIAPGVSGAFRPRIGQGPSDPPVAVVTTHPLHGLDWLLDLWEDVIVREVPAARLHVYSALLHRALGGEVMPGALSRLTDRVRGLAGRGVEVRAPLGETAMAAVYRAATLHLYPGHVDDMTCWTLAESQACGLPAVARALGATSERLVNGETGYLVPDGAAFANVAVQILVEPAVRRSLSAAAADPGRLRPWEAVALDIDRILTA
ncbi:glycosyltransferase [Rhodospirillum rubrum]|uniref:Glycosyl transferase, group 1 n=1 Tax=Rhodospirillum rubrum (strain ATCC 11170 / ATH 1.1.1 / DSM 467 / LMG 4362 / NCIMB 8255 / S1) TaxID=269796 RepID=Q2RQ59_RHORT|nr:glycosyltransferase [Rhodospirillum rubrum]ABC23736.1 hypothetical protein Rru_A2939 [Rhodospirillum rubrum ATCC 11170]AEO49475.1 hypothetical protein F11_15065 [Rhodospirillum rubrum F11]MBK5955412.1 hypothetical protein [Rhodospirillum rubrum]QXG79692.1 glycosyltransferase [Rhodospirillum rubrum]HAP99692.1 glycosyltransferase family 1 protein [Rhodospirillum rubrum]